MRRRTHGSWLSRWLKLIGDALTSLQGGNSVEKALRASERNHRELLEQAPDAIFIASRDGRFVDLNQRACQLLGYSRDELLGRSIGDVLSPEGESDRQPRMQALSEGKTLLSERELLRADGSRVPVEISTRLLSNGRLQGIARDITGRKEADAALRRSEERLRLALEASSVGIWESDLATGECIWSATARAHLGLSPEAPATVEMFLSRVHPEDRETAATAMAAMREGGNELNFQFRVVLPDGSMRHLSSLGRVSLDRDGQARRMVGTLRDITNRVNAQAKLMASEAQLRAIVAAAPECVKLLDRDGRVLDMNPAGLAMLETERLDDILGATATMVVVPEHRAVFEALTGMAFRGESGTGEFDIVGLHGTRRSLESSVAPLRDQGGQIVAALAVSRDVTERKLTEAALHSNEHLMRSVLEQTPIVLFATDRNGVFTLAQGKALASLGMEPDYLNGKCLFDNYAKVPNLVSSVRRALDGETVNVVVKVRDRIFDCTCTPMFDGSMVVGVTGVAT